MENNKKNFIILAVVITIFIGIALAIIIFVNVQEKQTPPNIQALPTPVSLQYSTPLVRSVSPPVTIPLLPDTKASFTVTFHRDPDVPLFAFVRKQALGTDTPYTIIPSSLGKSDNAITITLFDPIEPSYNYSVQLVDASGVAYASYTYTSTQVETEKQTTNNVTLVPFLPYETDTFRLRYIEERNIYVFNLKVNANDTRSFTQQFESAKAEAEAFIQSKGIRVEDIVIEWRHS